MSVENSIPSGTVTFLFSDIESSTRMWGSHPEKMRSALARHDILSREAIESHGGFFVKSTGDGVLAAFATASSGIAGALALQLALFTEPWPEETPIRVRVGVHTGTAELRGRDYFGGELSRTARLMKAGNGGQLLVSDVTYSLCRDSLPANVALRDLGEHLLADLIRPTTIYQLDHPDLPSEFPPLRTLDNPAFPNNLPRQVTTFVGRETTIHEVSRLLAETCLLSLTGAGGSGKTRLSIVVAASVLEHYPDGVWLAELASLADPALVPQTVASILDIREEPGKTITQTMTERLKDKRLLLLIDNVEHLLSACAALIAALLRACPHVTVLATSREPLNISGEVNYRVPSLSMPDPRQTRAATPDSLQQFEAVRLFTDRARAVKQGFAVTGANARAVAQLCYRLDGIALAIELAAARVRSQTVEEMVDKLDGRFRLLTGGDRTALPRHQTLRALIDWSYDLLNATERTLLTRLSIFAGGWTLEAAESVCGFAPIEDWGTLDLLTSLTDKSLIVAEEAAEGQATRYRMLETVRKYAREKVAASGDGERDLRQRHWEWCLKLVEEAEPKLTGPDQASWLNRLEVEHDNLRAAMGACAAAVTPQPDEGSRQAAKSGLRLASSLWRFWRVRGYGSEGREFLARALALQREADRLDSANESRSAADRFFEIKPIAKALNGMGILTLMLSDYPTARAYLEESRPLYESIGDKAGIASVLSNLGSVAYDQADYTAARTLYGDCLAIRRELVDKHGIASVLGNLGIIASDQRDHTAARSFHQESLTLLRELGDIGGIANTLKNLGNVAADHGDFGEAQALYEESLENFRAIGDEWGVANTLMGLGNLACSHTKFVEARPLLTESLKLLRKLSDKRGIAYGLEAMASLSASEGDPACAACLWASAGALRESVHAPITPAFQSTLDAEMAAVRAVMGDSAWEQAWKEGLNSSWEEAVDRAVGAASARR